ncbi:MAG: crossover junction endodeoxyribonuclease RuvC [Anaerovoracaceae bacterium]
MPKTTIIGIDPGTNLLGFGVIDVISGKPVFVDMGVLDLRKETDAYSKLRQIYDTVTEVCKTYHGTEMAESPFYGKNAQSSQLGRAQGAAMLAALNRHHWIHEYAPGGQAGDHRQRSRVQGAGERDASQDVERGFPTEHLDATDALAIALCHYYSISSPLAKVKGSGDWEKFIKDHPDRVK